MNSIVRWLSLRFLRLGLWVPAFIVPLLVYATAFFGHDGSVELANKVLLDMLVFGLALLTAITVLTSVDRARWGTILTRPIGLPRLVVGIWLGSLFPYLVCYFALTTIAVASTWCVRSGLETPPEGLEYYADVKIWRGLPASPTDLPGATHEDRADWLALGDPWTFEVEGIAAGAADLEARLVTNVGVLTSMEAGDGSQLYRIEATEARIRFVDDDGGDLANAKHLVLKNRVPVSFAIPRAAVMDDGRVRLVVARDDGVDEQPEVEHEHETRDHVGHASEDEKQDKHDHLAHRHDVFWFDRIPTPDRVGGDGSYRLGLNARGLPDSGLRVVKARHSMESGFLRLSLLGVGLLVLVSAMATFAATVFGPAVAFAFSGTIFICGISMSFLHEIVEGMKIQSASIIFRDPLKPSAARAPGMFDRLLEKMLNFWVNVLPDFQVYHGGDLFVVGDVARWTIIGNAYAVCACYSVAFFGLSLFMLKGWEIER